MYFDHTYFENKIKHFIDANKNLNIDILLKETIDIYDIGKSDFDTIELTQIFYNLELIEENKKD